MVALSAEANAGIEFGNTTSRAGVDLSARSTVVFASYNIRYAVGRFLIASGLFRKIGLNLPLHRAAAVQRNVMKAAKVFSEGKLLPCPDILALQEADKGTARAGKQHVASELARRLNVPYVHGSVGIPRGIEPQPREWWLNFEEQIQLRDPGETGVALLSRVPFEEVTRIDLPWHDCPWRPRLALAATVRWRDEKLRVINVHIDPHGPLGNQHRQTEKVLEQADEHSGPTVILGDFNSLSSQKAIEIRRLMESRGFVTPFATGTATWHGAALRYHADWIFGRGVKFKRSGVAKPVNVSDHWPIWAEVTLLTNN